MAVSALSRRDATLLSAEGIYRFLMDQFEKISISFSHELKSAVEFRLSERRQYDIVNLHRFLHNPTTQRHRSTIPSRVSYRIFGLGGEKSIGASTKRGNVRGLGVSSLSGLPRKF